MHITELWRMLTTDSGQPDSWWWHNFQLRTGKKLQLLLIRHIFTKTNCMKITEHTRDAACCEYGINAPDSLTLGQYHYNEWTTKYQVNNRIMQLTAQNVAEFNCYGRQQTQLPDTLLQQQNIITFVCDKKWCIISSYVVIVVTRFFYFWGFVHLCQLWWKSIKKCDRDSAHRRTHWQTDANRFYNLSHALCYSYGTDKNTNKQSNIAFKQQ